MRETIILPEMLAAGMEALAEAKKKKFSQHDTVISVFLAMRAAEEMYLLRHGTGLVH